MNIISITSSNDNVTVTPEGNNNQIGVSETSNLNNLVTTTISDTGVAVVSNNDVQYSLSLLSGATGLLNVSTEPNIINTVVTINQGQQGPPGASGLNGIVSVLNHGDNRLITASNIDTQIIAENNLLFDGTLLTVGGTPVSLSGHSHLSSDIGDFNSATDSRINLVFSGLSDIANKCAVSKVLIKDTGNLVKTISLSNFIDIIDEIDGGPVIFSGCP
jgi:hypothetical protein